MRRAPGTGTVLKALLRERHWQTVSVFRREYDRVAALREPHMVGHGPQKAQFYRWLAGELKSLPYPDHCRVLAAMFPDHTVEQLFEPATPVRPVAATPAAIAVAVRPAVGLGGLMSWVPATARREVA